jgi:hypothetical protein
MNKREPYILTTALRTPRKSTPKTAVRSDKRTTTKEKNDAPRR